MILIVMHLARADGGDQWNILPAILYLPFYIGQPGGKYV